jgi:adenosylhomocysteinase
MDDGADLVSTLHKDYARLAADVIGGTEETTTGVIRLRNMAGAGKLVYPIIAVNDAQTKHFFDNRYGTGQSTIDGITRATNILWAGRKVVVCGYGYGFCGKGIARRAQGLGAHVIVTEVQPIAALEAAMDGYQAMPLLKACQIGEVFITATGNMNVIDKIHILEMKDGAILANSGHFNAEINIPALEGLAKSKRRIRFSIDEYTLSDGRHIYLLGEGRLINLAAAEGHPASVMDMSFANQALCLEYLTRMKGKIEPAVYPVPGEIDQEVGKLKLASMNITIDSLTEEQKKYLASWESGT